MVSSAWPGFAMSANVSRCGFAVRLARPLLRILALISSLFLTSCGLFADVWEWNQRLTVEVLVDGQIVSGSAVSHAGGRKLMRLTSIRQATKERRRWLTSDREASSSR